MIPNEVTVLKSEHDPQATTGDGQPKIELFVGWPGVPTIQDKLAFEAQYPDTIYDAFHASNWVPSDESLAYENAGDDDLVG